MGIFTMRWIGAALLATAPLTFSGAAGNHPQPRGQWLRKKRARVTDRLSARRRTQHYADRRYDRPVYEHRPEYYRPYPYVLPAPFPLGLGFGPWW